MLMLDTAMCIIDINNAIREITLTLYPASSGSLADRYADLTLPWPVENALYAFMVRLWYRCLSRTIHLSCQQSNLGDVIIIWRTWAFYKDPRERWVLLIPMSLLVGSFSRQNDLCAMHDD